MSELISNVPNATPTASVSFTVAPEGSAITFVVGGDVYVSAAKAVAIGDELTFEAETDAVSPVKYEWDFGDGTIGHGAEVTHTYTIPNPHLRAHLKVTDVSGKVYECGKQIYLEDDSGTPPTVVRF